MNREKKQLVVIGVLVALVLSVGAFQFTRKDDAPAPSAKKDKPTAGNQGEKDVLSATALKYPTLMPLQPKDPFETAPFIDGAKAPDVKTPTPPVAHPLHGPGRRALENDSRKLPPMDFDNTQWAPGGNKDITPVPPPKPVFGYSLVGITEGAHPTAVFDDGKGNQQLVEAGQGLGPSATVLSISRGKVRVKFNAETLTFNVGGNP